MCVCVQKENSFLVMYMSSHIVALVSVITINYDFCLGNYTIVPNSCVFDLLILAHSNSRSLDKFRVSPTSLHTLIRFKTLGWLNFLQD